MQKITKFKEWLVKGMINYQDMAAGEKDQVMKAEYLGRADAFEEVIGKVNELFNEKEGL